VKPFLVSYRAHAAVIVAESKIDARDLYIAKFLKTVDGVDKRKIKQVELPGLEADAVIEKPKVLKTVVLAEG
jgi:hypothetical protein